MNLHENSQVFTELVIATADSFKIPEVYVEKDYWVTRALMQLSQSEYVEQVVFKGGTSLSKAYKLIQRFSEDIDLAMIVDGLNSNQVKKLIKQIEATVIANLEYIPRHRVESKHGQFRKTVYRYPRLISGSFGQASDELLLEINCFATPEPASNQLISSLIAEFLQRIGRDDLIEQYGLSSFELKVLHVERTLCEKVFGLIRASCADNAVQALKEKIRHIYDICMIVRVEHYMKFVQSEQFLEMLRIVYLADVDQFKDKADWLEESLEKALIFQNTPEILPMLLNEYQNIFSDMVFDEDLPSEQEIITVFSLIHQQLIRY